MPRFTIVLQAIAPDEDVLYDYLAFEMIKESDEVEDISILGIKEDVYGTAEFDFDKDLYE